MANSDGELRRHWSREFTVDARRLFLFQIPSVIFHERIRSELDIAELSVVTVTHHPSGRSFAAWAVGDEDEDWDTCETPPEHTARLSLAACRHLLPYAPVRSGDSISVTFAGGRLPLWPAHIEGLLSGTEIGLHRADAEAIGIGRWAVVNHAGVPAMFQVRLLDEPRDLGVARLSYQARLLLGTTGAVRGHPLIQVSPAPVDSSARPMPIPEPRWVSAQGRPIPRRRVAKAFGSLAEAAAAGVLRAPGVALRTTEAGTGEDQAQTVRIHESLFPLLGTEPGKGVSIEWGPGNRAIATALVAEERDEDWPSIQMIGRRPQQVLRAPDTAVVRVGAATRASLGIPRVTTVTVRRRVVPLIIGRLNELIIPATGLMLAAASRLSLRPWHWIAAALVVALLLLAPLRARRNPRGRVPAVFSHAGDP